MLHTHRLQKCAHMPSCLFLKKMDMAERSDSAKCTGCSAQCVK